MTDWPFGSLVPLRYGLAYADPAWLYELYSEKGAAKSPQAQYDCMTFDAMAALPVSHLMRGDAALVMWATAPMLPDAFRLMDAWGFKFKTAGAWAKQSSTGRAWTFGPGYILRSAAEFFLIGTIGSPPVRSRSIRNLIVEPVRGHSRKPEGGYELCESLYDGPYIELFSRKSRPGWDAWGNETGKFDGN